MTRLLFGCCATLAALILGGSAAGGEGGVPQPRTVAVASFARYAEIKQDLAYLSTLVGDDQLAAQLERLLIPLPPGRELAGLDRERPWGASLTVSDEGARFYFLVCLPVDDLGKLIEALTGSVQAHDAGDGIHQVEHNSRTFFILQKGKWAYAARRKEDLENLPDAMKQFQGLHEPYDLKVSVDLPSIPPALPALAVALVKQDLASMIRLGLATDDERSAFLAQTVGGMADGLLHTLDRLTLGLNIDRSNGRTYLDVQVTTSLDSNAAEWPAAGTTELEVSRLSGVALSDAIFSWHLNAPLLDADKERAGAWLKTLGDRISGEIDSQKDEGLDDEQRAKAKELAGKIVRMLDKTIKKEGRIEAGLVVTGPKVDEFEDLLAGAIEKHFPGRVHETIVGAGQVTVVSGLATVSGREWENVVMQIIASLTEGTDLDPPKWNVDGYKGWRFHAFSVALPQTMRAETPLRLLRNLLGNPLNITLAFGDDTFYVAVGEKGIDSIKRVIDRSAEMSAKKSPALAASVGLAPLWKLIASQNRGTKAAEIAANLGKSATEPVTFTLAPIAGGVRFRFDGGESLNKLLCVGLAHFAGIAVNLDSQGAVPPGPGAGKTPDRTVPGGKTPARETTTTTTTTDPDGTTTTETRTESNENGGQSSHRRITTSRRSSSQGRPGRQDTNKPAPENKATKPGKKADRPQTALRTWSSRNGKFKVEARFIEMQNDSVKLITDAGERLTVAIDKLSEDDQKVARQLAEELEKDPFAPKDD